MRSFREACTKVLFCGTLCDLNRLHWIFIVEILIRTSRDKASCSTRSLREKSIKGCGTATVHVVPTHTSTRRQQEICSSFFLSLSESSDYSCVYLCDKWKTKANMDFFAEPCWYPRAAVLLLMFATESACRVMSGVCVGACLSLH